jgi:hypothetical protein
MTFRMFANRLHTSNLSFSHFFPSIRHNTVLFVKSAITFDPSLDPSLPTIVSYKCELHTILLQLPPPPE